MTKVLFNIGQDTIYGVYGVDTLVTAKAATRRVSGEILVTRNQLRESDSKPFILDLAPTGLGQAWIITVSPDNGDSFSGYYKVPAGDTVNFTDLVEVDPETLEAVDVPEPEWWAVANSTVNSGKVVGDRLILTRTDGVEIDAGNVRGLPGQDGEDGEDGRNGLNGLNGLPGKDGVDGLPGKDGVDGEVSLSDLYGKAPLNVADFGVVNNGAVDSSAAWKELLDLSSATGKPILIPSNYRIGLASRVPFPDDVTVISYGGTFTQLSQFGRNSLLPLGNNTNLLGAYNLELYVNALGSGITVTSKSDVKIGDVTIINVNGGVVSNVRDAAVNVSVSSNVKIEKIKAKNFDWGGLYAENVYDLKIGYIDVENCIKGIHLEDVPNCSIRGAWVRGTSPNASYSPGHNGLLMESSIIGMNRNIHLENILIEDSKEHGLRISGPAPQFNIWVKDCIVKNVGGTGFKVLGSTLADANYNENISFDNCIVEDAGLVNQNTCGFLIQMCIGVRINNPIVRKRNKSHSCVEGMRFSGVSDVVITNPTLKDHLSFGVRLDEVMGNISSFSLDRGIITSTSPAHAVYLQNSGVDFKDINISYRGKCLGDGTIFYAGRFTGADTGTWTGLNEITIRQSDDSADLSLINSNSSTNALSKILLDIVGRKSGVFVGKAGSKWTDTATGKTYISHAGVWKEISFTV